MKRKFEEIIDYIEDLQAQNQLKQGERLPSIRAIAEQFACTKTTVIRAYKELESNHKIYAVPKGGYYVLAKTNAASISQGAIDFTEVMPDTALLPYREFTHCMNRAVAQYKDHLFTYCDPQGLLSLRKALIGHFADQQIFASEETIYITSGSQQALSILAKMPFPNGKRTILVEQPTYSLIQKTAELHGEKTIGIARDFDGIPFDELERIFKNEDVKFFYTMPRFHNPLGTSLSEKDKRRMVALAEKYDVYIVEDDYLVDLDRHTNVLPAHFYDVSGKVIYVKSFSKAFMPGIRLGAVVMNKALQAEFLMHKKCADLNTSVLAQGALELFINSGMYKKQIRKARLEYGKKMACLRECVTHRKTSGIEFIVPDMGFFVWIRLNEKIDRTKLIRRLKERNVLIASPEKNYIGQARDENSFGICIAKLSTEQIRAGISMICEEAEVQE